MSGCSTGIVHYGDACKYHQHCTCWRIAVTSRLARHIPTVIAIYQFNDNNASCIIFNCAIWPKANFIVGVVISSFGALAQSTAIMIASYSLFCFSAMLLGIAMGCAGFYRYVAADGVDDTKAAGDLLRFDRWPDGSVDGARNCPQNCQ